MEGGGLTPGPCFRSYAFQDDTVLPLPFVWKRLGQGLAWPGLLDPPHADPADLKTLNSETRPERIIHTGKGRLGNSPVPEERCDAVRNIEDAAIRRHGDDEAIQGLRKRTGEGSSVMLLCRRGSLEPRTLGYNNDFAFIIL